MKNAVSILCVLLLGALLLLRPEAAAGAVTDGLALCARTVIPTLLPFFVVTSLLLKLGFAQWLRGIFSPVMGPLFHLRGICAMPLLAGLLGGYPAGARTVRELFDQGLLTRREGELLLGFCNNCGPGFLVGFAGTVLGGPRAGLRLYAIHVLSALLTGLLLCRLGRDRGPGPRPLPGPAEERFPLSTALPQAISGALGATLQICAFVAVFRVPAALLPLPRWCLGLLEMVSAVGALSPSPGAMAAAAAIVGWGGLCVHCQTLAVIGDLSPRYHWAGKAIQAALSALLALALGR